MAILCHPASTRIQSTQRVWAPGSQVPYRSGRLSKHSGASSCQLKFGPILCVSWLRNKRLRAWACSRLPSNFSVSDCGPYRLTRTRQWTAGPEGKRPCLLTHFFLLSHPAHIETSIGQRPLRSPDPSGFDMHRQQEVTKRLCTVLEMKRSLGAKAQSKSSPASYDSRRDASGPSSVPW